MLNTAFSPWPSYTAEEIDAVRAVLESNRVNYWTGDVCRQFEREFAQWIGVPHAVSLANGTVALEVALKAMGIGSGDDVIVTPRSFVASASCVVSVGARPVFADVDMDSQNITAESILAAITPATRAIICVHLAGWPCEMDSIMRLAKQRGLWVIEDCAQAHGARYRGRMVGSIGHVGAWSFCQDKIMSTGGEGGMVTTSDSGLWEKMWSYKDHGKSWDGVYNRQHPPGFRWVHDSFGTNWRMLEMQAAIGRVQLGRMPQWAARRAAIAGRLIQALQGIPAVRVPVAGQGFQHAYYRMYMFVRAEALREGWSRDRIVARILELGVPCFHGSCSEIYRERCFLDAGLAPISPLPVARALGESSVAFLVHPTLTDAEVEKTIDVASAVMREASAG